MRKHLFKVISIAMVLLFCAATVAAAAQETQGNPVSKFFRRLFGWPVKTAEKAGETTVKTAEEAGKTGVKTVEDTGKVLVGKETPEKIVTTPVVGTAETGKAAVVGAAETAGTAVTTCPVVPEKTEEKTE